MVIPYVVIVAILTHVYQLIQQQHAWIHPSITRLVVLADHLMHALYIKLVQHVLLQVAVVGVVMKLIIPVFAQLVPAVDQLDIHVQLRMVVGDLVQVPRSLMTIVLNSSKSSVVIMNSLWMVVILVRVAQSILMVHKPFIFVFKPLMANPLHCVIHLVKNSLPILIILLNHMTSTL